ncbi:MAG: 4Fe-4S ferredoxin [Thermodesulfovibrionales bacterium]|jgi:ferredoxin
MCEFCTKHGEGKKWYDNISNYTDEVFHKVNSEKNVRAFLAGIRHSLKTDFERACTWKKRLPRIYNLIAYPLVTRHLKKTHFGQIVPIEDIEHILDRCGSVVRLPCVCRKVTIGEDRRYCIGIGMDLTFVYKDMPDFCDFEKLSSAEAKAFIRTLDIEGKTHSVWTFNTPFIGAICNCDRDCVAYRFQVTMKLGKAMWKGEYAAHIDHRKCNGCRECIERCYFNAVSYDRRNGKCSVDFMQCYGCGICRAVCKRDALDLLDRARFPLAANHW